MFVFDGESYWSGWGFLWADWSAHITYIFNMAHRNLFLSSHPLYFGIPFRYHFTADLISAVLLRSGFSLVHALIIPSVICSFLLVTSVYVFFRFIYKNIKSAMISTLLFLCNGGLGFIWYIYYLVTNNPAVQKDASIFRFTQIEEVRIEFTNLLTGYFIPQRPFLLGFPISIGIILYFILLSLNSYSKKQKKILFLLGILTGIFPIIHLYAYVVIISVVGFLFLWNYISRKINIIEWSYFFFPALVLGVGIFSIYWGFDTTSHIQFKPFWPMNGNIIHWVYYCTINGGLVFLLAPISWYFASRRIKILSIPFALIFLASNLFIFQPYSWDNGKFIAYACLWTSGVVGDFLSQSLDKYRNSVFIQICLILTIYMAIFSGAMDIANLTQFRHQKNHFFRQNDLIFGEKLRNIIPKDELILTGPYNTYVTMLAGRQLFIGYNFWINSYGIMTKEREKIVYSIYSGDSAALELLNQLNIRYIIVSPIERRHLLINDEFISENFILILKEKDTHVYRRK